MEILDKYKDIITRIEEMCTSTAAMAPYPVGATSITTYKYGKSRSKGSKEGKMPTPRKAIVEELIKQCKGNQKNKIMLNYKYQKMRGSKKMNISETMKEIATICEAIIKGEAISEDEFTKDRIKNNIKSFLGLEQKKHPAYFTKTAKELRDKQSNLDNIGKQADEFHARAERATGYRKQVNQENAADAERKYREANKDLRHAKGEVLDSFRSKGDSNPEAHNKLNKMMESIAEMCEAIISEGNFEEAKQKLDVAKQEKQRAWDILIPRLNQISKYVETGKKVPKLLDARYQRKYNAYKQAEQAEAQARKDFENS